jgi:hypothetical protein
MSARTYGTGAGELNEGTQISAMGTAIQKRLFLLWDVLALVVIFVAFRETWPANPFLLPSAMIISVVSSVLLAVGYFRLADEVIDAGDHLVIRKGDEEMRVPLHDVKKASASIWGVTLHLDPPVQAFSTISFAPARTLGRGAVLMSLHSRIAAAKRRT